MFYLILRNANNIYFVWPSKFEDGIYCRNLRCFVLIHLCQVNYFQSPNDMPEIFSLLYFTVRKLYTCQVLKSRKRIGNYLKSDELTTSTQFERFHNLEMLENKIKFGFFKPHILLLFIFGGWVFRRDLYLLWKFYDFNLITRNIQKFSILV